MASCNRMLWSALCVALIIFFSAIRNFNIALAQANSNPAALRTSDLGNMPEDTTVSPASGNKIQTLIARALNGNQIELRWAIANPSKAASLGIFRASSLDPRNFVQIGSVDANLDSYIDSNLKPRMTYYYRLKHNQQDQWARLRLPSNTAFATTPDGSEPNAGGVVIGRRSKPGVPSEFPPFGKDSSMPYDDLEEEMLRLLNRYRALKGLGPVKPSVVLSQSADQLSKRLAEADVASKFDITGNETAIRARMFNFPNYLGAKFDTAIFMARGKGDFNIFERMKYASREDSILTNPNWKAVGIARVYSEKDGGTRWVFDFADYSEVSLPENMIGTWHAQYQVSSNGVWRFNDADKYDLTDFTMTLRLNADGTWVSQGYKAHQTPAPQEAGVWKCVHDASRDEEIVTFYREDGKPAATIRVHAAPNVMTFFAVDGAAEMKNFFKGVPADGNPKDDPQIIFTPGPATFLIPVEPFPATLRCGSCPQVFAQG